MLGATQAASVPRNTVETAVLAACFLIAGFSLLEIRDAPAAPTRLDGVADDHLVAYSRLCTHAGCAVALYRDRDQALFCPCHQATFDARRGATPTGGPASVPLPQLPIAVDADGYLVATGDLSMDPGPVGGKA
jgi:ubiquinol-cytochrome c reductase iron-sulfur subunit